MPPKKRGRRKGREEPDPGPADPPGQEVEEPLFVVDRQGAAGAEWELEADEDEEEEREGGGRGGSGAPGEREIGEEETELAGLVFGAEDAVLEAFGRTGDRQDSDSEPEPEEDGAEVGHQGPAWVDDDDAELEVDIASRRMLKKLRKDANDGRMTGVELEGRLRDRFAKSQLTQSWAVDRSGDIDRDGGEENSDSDADDGVQQILSSASAIVQKGRSRLQQGLIDIARCKDANHRDVSKSVVRTVHFHPSGELLLTGGFDKALRFFQIDGENNPKVHGIFFQDLPIHKAAFVGDDQVVITGKKPFYYCYDVHSGNVEKVPRVFSSGRGSGSAKESLRNFAASSCGKWLAFPCREGYVMLVSRRTKQWVADFRLNGPADALAFTPDSRFLLASGEDGDIYSFDLRSQRCFLRFQNEGGTATRSLCVSPEFASTGLVAVGSASGVVNMYDVGDWSMQSPLQRPTPRLQKSLLNLVTPSTSLNFSPDGQVLAIASWEKRDALRLVHAESGTVFANWPTSKTPIRYPFSVDFSPVGGYLAVGNDRGRVLLYQMKYAAGR